MVPGRPKFNDYAYQAVVQPGVNGRRGYQPRGTSGRSRAVPAGRLTRFCHISKLPRAISAAPATGMAPTARCGAYLHPVQDSNLHVLTNTQALRLVFDGRRAVGVEVRRGAGTRIIRARGEVFLAGGAFNTPQLLMLSGVGDPAELGAHGIAVRHALPASARTCRTISITCWPTSAMKRICSVSARQERCVLRWRPTNGARRGAAGPAAAFCGRDGGRPCAQAAPGPAGQRRETKARDHERASAGQVPAPQPVSA